METIRSIIVSSALTSSLLPDTLPKEGNTSTHGFRLIILANDCKLAAIGLVAILTCLPLVLHSVYLIVYWILDSSETESSIKNSSAVLFVSLAEAWILMQLIQDFI